MTPPVLELFHPAVPAWFASAFAAPTAAQVEAWPAIQAGRHALIAAPTGSGKTLAAFLAAIDALVRAGPATAGCADETHVVYVSPLKALSNDIQRNLEAPLAGIRAELGALGPARRRASAPRCAPATRRRPSAQRMRAQAAAHPRHHAGVAVHPARLSESGRKMLSTARTVIVDEIHALAPNKRGAHLALSLERLRGAVPGGALTRIGLSATQKPIDDDRALPGRRPQRRSDGRPPARSSTSATCARAISRSSCRRRRSRR